MSIERIDQEENARINRLLKRARENHAVISQGSESHAATRSARNRLNHNKVLNLEGNHILNYYTPQAMGDAIMRTLRRREEFKAMQGEPVVHVKNGKPLTAYGAKLLGVPWHEPK